MGGTPTANLGASFTLLDGVVVLAFFGAVTLIGARMAGHPATIRDFFLGGRKLPWYAVSGSIIATEISALTFVGLPYVVFREGGDFTYLQLGLIGTLLARLIVGYVLVPAYYRREIYSPYDFIGIHLGSPAREVTTALFALGGVLSQSARLYLTALVLDTILGTTWLGWLHDWTGISTLTGAVWTIGALAVAWTLLGGITTVIWTDVLLFFLFLTGGVVSLGFAVSSLSGGWTELFSVAQQAGKFRLLNFETSPAAAYTFWTAIVASTWHNVGAYGTDQLVAQRMFCCRGPGEARKAIIASYAGLTVTILVMLVGAGLYAYYQAHPLEGEALRLYREDGNRIFPIFIVQVLPPGVTGLAIAAIFAAAISSLDSLLAALSQTTMSAVYLPWKHGRASGKPGGPSVMDFRTELRVSRWLVAGWGVVLCVLAQLASAAAAQYPSLLDLGLSMAGYAGGALIAGFLLAYLPLGVNATGYVWSAPLSVATVFAFVWHQPWAKVACVVFVVFIAVLWLAIEWRGPMSRRLTRTAWVALSLGMLLAANHWAYVEADAPGVSTPAYVTIAWPWYSVIGTIVAFAFGYLLSEPRSANSASPPERAAHDPNGRP